MVAVHTTHVPCRVVEIMSLLDKASGHVVAQVRRVTFAPTFGLCGVFGMRRVMSILQAPASVKRGDVCVVRMLPLQPLILESFADYPPLGRICWYEDMKC